MRAGERETRSDRGWCVLLVALAVAPLLVSAVALWFSVGSSYHPPSDWALLELRTRDALNGGVLVGPYSRFGWTHPGPLLFYVLAIPYKMLGSKSIALPIGALAVNAATIAAGGWVAYRRGRLASVIAIVVPLGLLTHALGADHLRNPWNPYLPVLPLLLLLLLAWSVAVGDLWMLPIAVAVASFVIQSHVGLALESVVFMAGASTAALVRTARDRGPERRDRRTRLLWVLGASTAVFVVLWLPVAYATIVRRDGNLGQIAQFFTEGHETAGWGTALRALGLQWGPRPVWLLGPRAEDVGGYVHLEPHWWLALWLVFAAAATALAVRRRATDTVWFAGFTAAGLVAAVVSVSNIVGLVFPYLILWTWVLGTALAMLVLQGLWAAVPPARRATFLRVAAPAAVLAVGILGAMQTVDALDAGTPFAAQQARERTVTRQVLRHLPAGRGPVLVDTARAAAIAPGIVLALERHGIPVDVSPDEPRVYGGRRSPRRGPYRAQLTVVSGPDAIRAAHVPGRRVAHYLRPQTGAERRAVRSLLDYLEHAAPGASRDAQLRIVRRTLHEPAEEVAVYLNP